MVVISKRYKVENIEMRNYNKLSDADFFIKGYKRCVVLGNGMSAVDYKHENDDFTIGVNDICRIFTPNILLLVDTRAQFKDPKRIAMIEKTNCIHVIRDACWQFNDGSTFLFKLGERGSFNNFSNPDVIDSGWDSPYMACMLAAKIGFKKIDLIGVDYTDNHFYKEDGPHELIRRFNEVDSFYGKLYEFLNKNGVTMRNLSKISKLTTIPKYI